MSETEQGERRLIINGRVTTQEALRANANQTLESFPNTLPSERGMAEAILALLDLLESGQDLIDYLTDEGEQ
jgi:hypothetical protein